MPRHCPDCKAQMSDDGINCWCVNDDCSFSGYVDLQTGKIHTEPTGWAPGIECEHGYDACPICDTTTRS